MTKVYFSKNIEKILDKIDYSKLGKKVAIKVHFGEKGCKTYISPQIVKKVYEKIINLGKKAALVECNVLYRGSRTNSTDHLATAKENGFDFAPIDILDGEEGSEYVEINGCKIGKGIKKYDSLIALTHFKGHESAGFGGAIKNLGMGLGSRAGKLHMHSTVRPTISEKCTACGECIKHCPTNAITIDKKIIKAKINSELCIGCARCIAVCPNKAVKIPWESETAEGLQKKIALYAHAVLTLFPNAIFINVLEKITPDCDCLGTIQEPMMPDIGIVSSTDIVAVEKASLDLANKFSRGKFNKINSVDKDKQISFAEELELGSSKYDLVEL
jgi:uncharacterized Fe-S center protein